ncbi:TetR/AcrR family transcriptional regulator [Paenibacillus kandeliae]|uniref:TetR/AcrR family transcriptional regulator n=1 Tax=Paenibacillus kandeliae TaxID=3231269 RepID=UPI003458A39C
MNHNDKTESNQPQGTGESTPPSVPKMGRKRDHTRDAKILEAAIDILAEAGYDGMTMDMIATRAKAGKATVYRRWSSKVEVVRDALSWMNQSHLELESLPDTGTLRGDLLAVVKPSSMQDHERKFRIFAKLGSFLQHAELPELGLAGIFDPWVNVNRELMRRAQRRGEVAVGADIEMVCQVITSSACYRGLIEHKTFDTNFYAGLIDHILLPALMKDHASHE